MTMNLAGVDVNAAATATYAHLFDALSDPTRLAILQHLATGEHRVRDLVEHLGLAQSTVSAHLACLKECGLVAARPEGRSTVLSLAAPAPLAALLRATEDLLGATGARVSLCSHLVRPEEG